MRILHVVPSYIPAYRYGGTIRSVHGLCKGLVKLGHDIHVFTTNVDGPSDSDVPLRTPVNIDGVKVWYFPSNHLRRLYWSQAMSKVFKLYAKGFDILHLHSIYLWPTWAAARAAHAENIPYIITPHGMLVKELIRRKSRLLKLAWIHLIERHNLEHASSIHMTSKREVDEASRFGFHLPSVFVVPNGVDFQSSNRYEEGVSASIRKVLKKTPFLLFLGRVSWEKGLDRLIPALSNIPDVHLIIAGNDEENYRTVLEPLADKFDVKNRITFTGPVYGADKTALLRHAAIVVLPSYSENFGIVVMEAMAAGRPVVVTPEVGLADTVQETGAGLVVEGKSEKLGEAIKSLLSKPTELEQMGKRGRKAVEDNFTWDAVARKMEMEYYQILKH